MRKKLILCFLIIVIACNKSKDELSNLPERTQTGNNTLGFKLNRRVWTINGKYCYNQWGNCRDNPLARYFSYGNGGIVLTSDRVIYKGVSVASSETFELSISKSFNRLGVYRLKGVDSLFEAKFIDNNISWSYYKLVPNRETFQVNITRLDTIAKVVSGEFSGTLYKNDNLSDSVAISEGRFDIKMQ
jgi:hypothetical protein